ncbi:MAG: phosphodiester glycosidase family protein [Bacilli bacterium]|nr:phosphodiester glycosidase family protein [Bacilli bacterium]
MKKITIFTIIIDVLVLSCFFIFYGPFSGFKRTLISTALNTKTHQYIAYTFYSEEEVSRISQANSVIPFDEEVNVDDIVIDTKPKESYDNEYDEAILDRDEDALYKVIDVEVGSYDAHLVAIYDPSKVKLITSESFNTGTGAETVLNMCSRLNGIVCVNGGGFADPDGWGSDIPIGYLIKDGQIIWSDSDEKSNIIGISNDNKLILTYSTGEEALAMGIRDALEFGPFLIVNGNKLQYSDPVGGYSRAARVAIAQRQDGVMLFLVTEGTHGRGPTMLEVADLLEQYGAYNAANLDGGTSSQLVINNELINTPINIYGKVVTGGRAVVSGFGLIAED